MFLTRVFSLRLLTPFSFLIYFTRSQIALFTQMLFSFAVVRFGGLGTGNKRLYIIGGVCLVAGMALKQLGNVRGVSKKLGQ